MVTVANLLVGLVFIALGIMIKNLKWYRIISGYNNMTKEQKLKVNLEEFGQFISFCLYLIGGLFFLGALLSHLKIPNITPAMSLAIIALIIFMLNKFKEFDLGYRKPDGTLKTATKLIFATIIIFFIFTGFVYLSITSSPKIEIDADYFQIEDLYAVKIEASDINQITIEEKIPKRIMRLNGFNLAGSLKGHFELENTGIARLYVNVNNPPFIYIHTSEGLIILNQNDRESTEQLFRKLSGEF